MIFAGLIVCIICGPVLAKCFNVIFLNSGSVATCCFLLSFEVSSHHCPLCCTIYSLKLSPLVPKLYPPISSCLQCDKMVSPIGLTSTCILPSVLAFASNPVCSQYFHFAPFQAHFTLALNCTCTCASSGSCCLPLHMLQKYLHVL